MSMNEEMSYADFVLPPTVVTRVDIARLITELEHVDSDLTSASARAKAGANAPAAEPLLSEWLAEFVSSNQLTLDDSRARSELIKQMHQLKDAAPVIHMTFAGPADQESLQTLAKWMRESVHPQAVIAAGLQPALVAGVYLRTPNRVHDLSLRSKLEGTRDLLQKTLEATRG